MPPVGNSAPAGILATTATRAASQTLARGLQLETIGHGHDDIAASGAAAALALRRDDGDALVALNHTGSTRRQPPETHARVDVRIGNAHVVEQDVLEVGAGRRSTDQRRFEQRADLDLDEPELVAEGRSAVRHPLRPGVSLVPERLGARRDDGAAVSLDAPVAGRRHGYPPPRTAAATLLAAVGPNDRYNRFGVAAPSRTTTVREPGSTWINWLPSPSAQYIEVGAPGHHAALLAHRRSRCRLVAVVTLRNDALAVQPPEIAVRGVQLWSTSDPVAFFTQPDDTICLPPQRP